MVEPPAPPIDAFPPFPPGAPPAPLFVPEPPTTIIVPPLELEFPLLPPPAPADVWVVSPPAPVVESEELESLQPKPAAIHKAHPVANAVRAVIVLRVFSVTKTSLRPGVLSQH
jgi:hypothetical protein